MAHRGPKGASAHQRWRALILQWPITTAREADSSEAKAGDRHSTAVQRNSKKLRERVGAAKSPRAATESGCMMVLPYNLSQT